MLPKTCLTSHSRMSGSRWVITPLWLSGFWKSFLYSYSVYSSHLFLILSASVRSIPFLSFIMLIFAWNVSFVSLIFLMRSPVFPSLWFCSVSLCCSLRKPFLSLLLCFFLYLIEKREVLFAYIYAMAVLNNNTKINFKKKWIY